jgi:acyl-homoserine lactone acylase PvdQ
VAVLEAQGEQGLQIIRDIDQYLAGLNEYRRLAGSAGAPWTRNDVLAVATLISAVFGRGGGDEARRSQFLTALQQRLGTDEGALVWRDLREEQDPETSVSVDGFFPQEGSDATPCGGPRPGIPGNANGNLKPKPRFDGKSCVSPPPLGPGNVALDANSLDTSAARASAISRTAARSGSNAVLVGAKRSATGRPLFVAGPQVGYFYPNVLLETDLHGGGIDARGVTFAGSGPYVQLGRGQDYAWSATSAGNDVIDHFVETLCGDDTHYLHNGECREMSTFFAGTLGSEESQDVVFK